MPTSNFQPITLLDPDFCYKFAHLMANSADPDQFASSEANWSGSTLFAKQGISGFSRTRVKPLQLSGLIQQSTDWWYFFLFFPENRIWYFMQIDISCKLSPLETVCMKCQILFSGKNKKCNWRQFAWKVKFCFLGKIRKIFQNVC